VADLGNLKPGPTPDQTATRITQVCEMIHQAGAQVILIGPSQVATIQQLDGLKHHLQKLDTPKPLSLTVLDSKLDMDYNPHGNQDHNFLNNIFLNPEPILYDFALIGHQNYLSDAGQLAFLDQSSFVSRRLGQHRDNPQQSEPYLRQADCLSIDVACINGLEMPAVSNPEPLGFKGEEWCQLCWYAGNSPKLKTIGIYGYQTYKDPNLLAAKLIAIGLWHLLEGMSQVDGNQQITEYRIASPGLDELVFACQPDQRYWLTLTKNHIKSLDDQVLLFGCQKNDYQEVINGEVPQTLVRVMNRLSIYEKQAKKVPKSHGKTKRNKASS
jgi:formiminoglutamase